MSQRPDFLNPTPLRKPGSLPSGASKVPAGPIPVAPPPVRSTDSTPGSATSTGGENRRLNQRPVCSFPGLMKVLIPEDSFVPRSFAVRVANLSNTGALVEVHTVAQDVRDSLNSGTRFFELKIALPAAPLVRGTVAWVENSNATTTMGLRFAKAQPDLVALLLAPEGTGTGNPEDVLPPPILDPFPPRTASRRLLITGRAPEADRASIYGDGHAADGPVKGGKFEVEITLRPDSVNNFTLRTSDAFRKSRPVPIVIIHRGLGGDTDTPESPMDLELSNEPGGRRSLVLGFKGRARDADRLLYRFAQLCPGADQVSFKGRVTSDSPFDEEVLRVLRREAKARHED